MIADSDDVITETIATVLVSGPDLFGRASAALAVFYDAIISDPRKARRYAESAGVATIAERKRAAVARYTDFVTEQVTGFLGDMDDRTKSRLTMAPLVLAGGVAISRDDYIELHARMLVDAIATSRVAPTRKSSKSSATRTR